MAKSNQNLFFALVAGALGGAFMTALRPAVSDTARPVAKKAARAGILIYEQARQVVDEWAEKVSDVIAEAQAELDEERQKCSASEGIEAEQVVPFEARAGTEAWRKPHA